MRLLLLLLPILGVLCQTEKECGQDEVFTSCGTCEPTCENKMPICTRDCKIDVCRCAAGFVRHKGRCIFPAFCPKVCKENEKLLQCGTACEPTCEVPEPIVCTMQCLINVCQCKDGFVRNKEGDCVEKKQCPQIAKPSESSEEEEN